MDRQYALELLPAAYRRALKLRADGVPESEIAEQLLIDRDAVGTFFQLANAKLAALLAADDGTSESPPPAP